MSPKCAWHIVKGGPDDLGYLAWHDKAARSLTRGIRTKFCRGCGRYFFPWERVKVIDES